MCGPYQISPIQINLVPQPEQTRCWKCWRRCSFHSFEELSSNEQNSHSKSSAKKKFHNNYLYSLFLNFFSLYLQGICRSLSDMQFSASIINFLHTNTFPITLLECLTFWICQFMCSLKSTNYLAFKYKFSEMLVFASKSLEILHNKLLNWKKFDKIIFISILGCTVHCTKKYKQHCSTTLQRYTQLCLYIFIRKLRF